MPHVRSLKFHIEESPVSPRRSPQTTDLPFQFFFACFPGLLELDISEAFPERGVLIYITANSVDIPSSALELLAFARAETTLQPLIIRDSPTNEILRFHRLQELEGAEQGYGFEVELWHEW